MTQTNPMNPSARRIYVDAMKGLGILLVVWGHFEEYYRGTSPLFNGSFECMYLFHMALFCLCSGLVAKFNWKKLVLQQVWLYLLCQALMILFRTAVLNENLAETGGLLLAWLVPWRHMWYLYSLIFWELTVPPASAGQTAGPGGGCGDRAGGRRGGMALRLQPGLRLFPLLRRRRSF